MSTPVYVYSINRYIYTQILSARGVSGIKQRNKQPSLRLAPNMAAAAAAISMDTDRSYINEEVITIYTSMEAVSLRS